MTIIHSSLRIVLIYLLTNSKPPSLISSTFCSTS